MSLPVSTATQVTLHFTLSLADGQLVDSTTGRAPAQCVPGDGSLLPAFDACLLGLQAGDSRQFAIPAVDAFGVRRQENLKRVARSRFAADMPLEPGVVISFAANEGGELPGVVHRVLGDMVEVDFNHPLAGKDLLFEVEILAVQPAGEASHAD